MRRFTLPRDIYFGEGSMYMLSKLKGHMRAMIVTGASSMQRFGFLEKLKGILREAEMEVSLFEGVEPDPSVETVMRGAQAMREFKPDLIVSLGGGSSIDAAKAMWIFYEYPDLTFEEIQTPFSMPELRKKARFVAIPSTSGAASEVSSFAIITDYDKGIKYPLTDYEITPDIAILDPDMAQTMPKSLIADTGMDALTHAVEAYVASNRSEFSDPLALQAITLLADDLQMSFHGDTAARARVHYASCLAGMAFSNALLGITHSLTHKMSAQFHLPHGRCNAVLLPYVISYNARICCPRYAGVARYLGLTGRSDAQLCHALVERIQALNTQLCIPNTLKACGVDENTFFEQVGGIAHHAMEDPCTESNPREATEEDLKQILFYAFDGKTVAF